MSQSPNIVPAPDPAVVVNTPAASVDQSIELISTLTTIDSPVPPNQLELVERAFIHYSSSESHQAETAVTMTEDTSIDARIVPNVFGAEEVCNESSCTYTPPLLTTKCVCISGVATGCLIGFLGKLMMPTRSARLLSSSSGSWVTKLDHYPGQRGLVVKYEPATSITSCLMSSMTTFARSCWKPKFLIPAVLVASAYITYKVVSGTTRKLLGFTQAQLFRNEASVNCPSKRDIHWVAQSIAKQLQQVIKPDPDNPHQLLALDRKICINMSILTLSKVWKHKVYDVCGVQTRYLKEVLGMVTCVTVLDAKNESSATPSHSKLDLELVRPGSEVRSYNGPVLLSLSDWYYTQEQICKIFANFGGLLITINFIPDGKPHNLYDQGSYVAGVGGVVMDVDGGDRYKHGYHLWQNEGFLASQDVNLRYDLIVKVGHLTVYYLKPFNGTVHEDDTLRSVSLSEEAMALNVIHTGDGNYCLDSCLDGQMVRTSLRKSIIMRVATSYVPETVEGAKRLLGLLLKHEMGGDQWADHYHEYWQAIVYESCRQQCPAYWWVHNYLINCGTIKRAVLFWLLKRADTWRQRFRRVWTHTVSVRRDLPQIKSGKLDENVNVSIKSLFQAPRNAVNVTFDNGTGPVPDNRRAAGQMECGNKHPKQGDSTSYKRTVTNLGVERVHTAATTSIRQEIIASGGGAAQIAPATSNGLVPRVEKQVPAQTTAAVEQSKVEPATVKDRGKDVHENRGGRQQGRTQHKRPRGRPNGPPGTISVQDREGAVNVTMSQQEYDNWRKGQDRGHRPRGRGRGGK